MVQMIWDFIAGLLQNHMPGLYRFFKKLLKPVTGEKLFYRSFKRELKKELKKQPKGELQDLLKRFKKEIKKDKKGFRALLKTGCDIDEPVKFCKEIKPVAYRRKLIEAVIGKYPDAEKFREKAVELVHRSLDRLPEMVVDVIGGDDASKALLRDRINTAAASGGEGKIVEAEKKQIKILSIIASPEADGDPNLYIHYEQEQDTMLDTFKDFDCGSVFPDMPDPVDGTLEEIAEYLEDGHHDILHITAHGGKNEKGEGVLYLETSKGEAVKVTGAELAAVLKPAPVIVILSACRSAGQEPELVPAAQALFDAAPGVKVVIGMKTAVSHAAAVDFNTAFLKALCDGQTVKEAFEKGKDNIMKGEAKRKEDNPAFPFHNEHEVPLALWRKGSEGLSAADFSGHRIDAPGRPGSHDFLGAKYLERGFIGRRGILRKVYRMVEANAGAVVFKGPGGIGKSTLTTRVAAHLPRKGYEIIVIPGGETTVERILEKLSREAAARGIAHAEAVYSGKNDELEKLAWFVKHFLIPHSAVIIFDNFESNQDDAKDGEFINQGLKRFMLQFRDWLRGSRSVLFLSTRYRVPGFHVDETVQVGEFPDVEFRKMLQSRAALKRLDRSSVKILRAEMGGNPRALDLLDRVAREEFGERDFTWDQLKGLMPGLRGRLLQKQTGDDDFTPLFLDRLVGYLSKPRRKLLNAVSVFRIPVGDEALKALGVEMDRESRRQLEDLSLLENLRDEGLYYVHQLTAHFLSVKMGKATRKRFHIRAAEYFEGIRNEEGKKYIENDIASRRHFLEAGEWDRAAEITFDIEDYLTLHGYPRDSFEMLREFDDKAVNEKNRSILLHQLGILYQGFGAYDEALTLYRQSMEIKEKIGDIKGVSDSLHNIGAIYQEKGAYDAALTHYRQSMEISEKVGDIKGVSYSLHQIGMIYQEKGAYDEALTHYRKAKESFEKIGDIKGVSSSLHQIGRIYQEKGAYDEALTHYRQSMELREKIGDIKGISYSLHQIGIIYEEKGAYDEALTHSRQSMEISEKIGDIVGVARSNAQIGILYLAKEEFETALKLLIRALLVFVKVGSPNAKQAAGDIARVREKLSEKRFAEILAEYGLGFDEKESVIRCIAKE